MAVPWPVSLQQIVNSDGFAFSYGETAIRTSMDIGPAKVRRRFTKPIDTLRVTINLTTSEQEDLYFFYNTDLNGGVTTFELDHPITGDLTVFRFTSAPQVTHLGGGNFRASMEWEIVE